MSIKKYGLYLFYPPAVKLSHEGLGRYLIGFLKAAARRTDLRLVVACPSWFREDLINLCKLEGVDINRFDLISPRGKIALVRFYELYLAYRRMPLKKKSFATKFKQLLNNGLKAHKTWIERKMVSTRSILFLFCIMIYEGILIAGYYFLSFFLWGQYAFHLYFIKKIKTFQEKFSSILVKPNRNSFIARLYPDMEKREAALLLSQINKLSDIKAWFCHAAFWPSFNAILAPRLMCVPDVVLSEFPISFAKLTSERHVENFKAVEKAIRGASNIVTYSNHIKWETLVKRYAVSSKHIHIVPHPCNNLLPYIEIQNFKNNEKSCIEYCQFVFLHALLRTNNTTYISLFKNSKIKFLFYASQFRPSKNMITLLRAYEFLLKKRFLQHKLILTCRLESAPELQLFIKQNNLARDVLFLHDLTITELAACYKIADLAVNPSLSEGGCPFTFSEALSVNTPVIMANISVTKEVIKHTDLQEKMLFDPYSWQELANRIQWALANRELLLSSQQIVYQQLAKRNWDVVFDNYIHILDAISDPPSATEDRPYSDRIAGQQLA